MSRIGDPSGPGSRASHEAAGASSPKASIPIAYRNSWPRPATFCDLTPAWKGEFRDFQDWVNFATARLTGTFDSLTCREIHAICIDSLGRRCVIGAHFMRARDDGAFPVRYFWECAPAQGIAARSGETGTGSTEGKSPVAEGEAPQ